MRLRTRLFLAFFLFAFLPVAGLSYLSLELGIGSLDRIASPGIEEALVDAHALVDGTLEAYAEKMLDLTPTSPLYPSAEQYLAHGFDVAVLVTRGDTTSAGGLSLSGDFLRRHLLARHDAQAPGESPPGTRGVGGQRSGWMMLEGRVLVYALRWSHEWVLATGCWLPVVQGDLLQELAFHLQRFEELKLVLRGGGRRMLRLIWGLGNLLYLLLILMVSQWTARSLTRPLADLERLAGRVGPGQWDVHLPYRRKDEVGALVDGFNRMSIRLAQATEQLLEAERTAAWQQTARTIAHGIKNSLAPVKLALARVPARESGDDSTPEAAAAGRPLDTVRSELERLERIARDFSLFGRPIDIEPVPTQPNPIVQQAVRLCESFSAAGIGTRLGDGLPPISIDPYMLREALVNLLKNACEAAGADGQVVISTLAHERGVRIEVRDDGPGIPPEVEEHLFDPYVTTKPSGSGLGLAIVKKIVDSLGGRISYCSDRTGTAFCLDWSAADEQAGG